MVIWSLDQQRHKQERFGEKGEGDEMEPKNFAKRLLISGWPARPLIKRRTGGSIGIQTLGQN